MKHILNSHTVKQLLGAVAGMAIAGVIYVAVEKTADMNIKGLLVSTNTVPSTDIALNDKTADEATLRRIAQRAATVAATLQQSNEQTQAETPVTDFASSRRFAREAEAEREQLAEGAKTYVNDPNVVMSEEDRLAIRAARVAGLPAPEAAPELVNYGYGEPPSNMAPATLAEAPIVTVAEAAPMHSGAEMVQAPTNLPNSGLGMNLPILASCAGAFAASKTRRMRLASMLADLR